MVSNRSIKYRFTLLIYLFFVVFSTDLSGQKIFLEPSMAISESGNGAKAGNLLDEQALAADPKSGKGGNPTTTYFPGWESLYYPAHVILDLKDNYDLQNIYFYDASKESTNINVEFGDPFNWKPLLVDPQNQDHKWVGHDIKITTRFLRFTLTDKFQNFTEVVLYGSIVLPKMTEPLPKFQLQPTVDEFIGINGFVTNPVEKLSVAGMVREYHLWNWDESNYWDNWNNKTNSINTNYAGYPNNQIAFNSPELFQFDDFYLKCNNSDLTVSPCIQGSVSWLTKGSVDKPVPIGSSTVEPKSYTAHANYLYQFIARYASQKVSDNLLKLATNEKRVSGLNILKYIENSNEPDRWWEGTSAYFSPYELAAMSSADYDGHLGTMGNTVGVKNADPDCKMVLSGLTRISLDYIRMMKLWSDKYRNSSFPADVINFHQYSTDADGQSDNATTGISPEQDNLKGKMKTITDYRNKFLPGKEVWLSEFGYDTDQGSIFKAPAIAGFSSQEVQAQWLIRSLLELAAAGVDRAIIYRLADDDGTNTSIRFATSGLTLPGPEYSPKIAWYYIYTMKTVLRNMRFNNEIISNEKVRLYSFKEAGSDKGAYVIWSPTNKATTLKNYQVSVGNAKSAKLVELEENNTKGRETLLNIIDKKVTVNISERPVFIVVDNMPAATLGISKQELNENITIYPTETDKEIYINLTKAISSTMNIHLIDSRGIVKQQRMINSLHQENIVLDISSFSQGTYFLQIESEGTLRTEKIIKY